MRPPILGHLTCVSGYGCVRCGAHAEANVVSNVVHDVRCWSWGTAFFNLRCRLFPPDWM